MLSLSRVLCILCMYGNTTEGEPVAFSGSFRVQELGAGLGEGRTEIKQFFSVMRGFENEVGV